MVVAFAACSGKDADQATADSIAAADSARDLATVTDSAAQPQLKDVPVTPPPAPPSRPKSTTSTQPKATQPTTSAPAPAPAPVTPAPPPAPRTGTVASGTTLTLASATKVCTNTNKVGDRFNATLSESVSGTNGAVIPAGSTVSIELTELKRSEDSKTNIVMGFRVVSVTVNGKTYDASADVMSANIERVRSQKGGDDAKKVGAGAAAGAVVGQILGRNTKGTLIGAAVGAAAGAAAASATSDYEGCVNSGAPVVVKLTSPLTIEVAGH
jgi:hypothetical protein